MSRIPALAFLSAAALCATALSPSARAGDIYLTAFGGLSLQRDQSSLRTDNSTFEAARMDFDPGFVVGGAVGYRFDTFGFGNVRVEAELSYRENSIDNGFITSQPGALFTGDNSSMAGMAVVYYDFTDISRRFVPYVGLGAGLAGVESDVYFTNGTGGRTEFGGPTDTEFAWQAIVGMAIPITERFDFTVDGRFYSTGRPDWLTVTENGNATGRFRSEFDAWHLNAGVRFKF
ncbi:outer surface protein [Iodidimonas gelatinilytica]|uniref:Outer surface protein n=1 Tax=Iodidimonas gelatinilytica TaxID=1236966 RepID=A0A5A7MRM5_9PROT|nr:outer membrane beta-barrel protein [Iodidimonas gelatinilytica]GEQ97655.1 outer surface protein [Iodidimonas gelatinilytica]